LIGQLDDMMLKIGDYRQPPGMLHDRAWFIIVFYTPAPYYLGIIASIFLGYYSTTWCLPLLF